MKIKTIPKSYDEILAMPEKRHIKPSKPSFIFRTLARVLSIPDLIKAKFRYTGKLPPKSEGPFLVLMNHSSFLDLKIAEKILYPRSFGIVCAQDAMVGKSWLMRRLGCIPTTKFVSDLALIHDMKHFLDDGINVLMYPEAGYSIDGRATPLPTNFANLVKLLKVPVVYIKATGAFHYQPLYNELRTRKVPVSAEITTLISREQLKTLDTEQIDKIITEAFSFDYFREQKELGIRIDEPERAEGLWRVLYKCPHCKAEAKMRTEGAKLICGECGKSYVMTELGELRAEEGETEFLHIPDWYEWQRSEVRSEILGGRYHEDIPVEVGVLNDWRAFYTVGEGRLIHTTEGFRLTGCDGKLDYIQKAKSSYTLNADFFWYEIADTVSLGTVSMIYYCFPKTNAPVAKLRIATEELYKLHADSDFHHSHENIPKD